MPFGVTTLVTFSLVFGTWVADNSQGTDAELSLVTAAWIVSLFALPIVVVLGVPLGWMASRLVGGSRSRWVHVAAWAAIGVGLGTLVGTMASGAMRTEIFAVALMAGFSAALGRAVTVRSPGDGGGRGGSSAPSI